jgi:hypothetical protein
MGVSTYFNNGFTLDRPLDPRHLAYLKKFGEIRHVKRDAAVVESLPDPLRTAIGLPVGIDGMYFTGDNGEGNKGKNGIVNGNYPPGMDSYTDEATDLAVQCPGLYCQWTPNDEGTEIAWDEGEKFYEYTEWIKFLILHFLKPWGYVVNGDTTWTDDEGDAGEIIITDNVVKTKTGVMTYVDDD